MPRTNHQKWSPDTCPCIVEYNLIISDDNEVTIEHTKTHVVCDEHKSYSGLDLIIEIRKHNKQYNTTKSITERATLKENIKNKGVTKNPAPINKGPH